MSRQQGEILCASLHPVCVAVFHFPERSPTPLLQSWRHQSQTEAHRKVTWLVLGKQFGTHWVSQHKIHQRAALMWHGWVTSRKHCLRAWKCLHLRYPFPFVMRRGRETVETAKLFLLFALLFSCMKPAGTTDEEDTTSFLSDQLLSGVATQGGSFPGEMSKDKGQK